MDKWPPLLKWLMSVLGTILAAIVLMIVVEGQKAREHRVRVEMRLDDLEVDIARLPDGFPPSKTRERLAIIQYDLAYIKRELDSVSRALREHMGNRKQNHGHQLPGEFP